MQCDTLAHMGREIRLGFKDLAIMGLPYNQEHGAVVMNGSICGPYFCYRADRYPYAINPRLVLCDYDQKTNTATNPRHIRLETNTWGWTVDWLSKVSYPQFHQEDPRLYYENKDTLALFFGDGFKVWKCRLFVTDDDVEAYDIDIVLNDWLPTKDGRVKNYTPITGSKDYIYQINPFMTGDKVYGSWNLDHWETKYGTPRGGTPAIKFGDNYLSFFHSSSEYRGVKHYYMGAFEFNLDIGLVRFSRYPLVAPLALVPEKTTDGTHKLPPCGNVQVVFPAGVTESKWGWHVSYGYNDTSTRVIHICKPQLEHNLVTVTQKAELPYYPIVVEEDSRQDEYENEQPSC